MRCPGLAITVYSSMPGQRQARHPSSDQQGSARDQHPGSDQLGGQMQDDLWTRPIRPYQRAAADVQRPPHGHERPDHEAIAPGARTHGFIVTTRPRGK